MLAGFIECVLLWDQTRTPTAQLCDIILTCAVSVTSVWTAFCCNHLRLDGTRKRRQRADLSRLSLSQGERPYQRLEICCCDCDIISCPGPGPVKIRGASGLWFRHLVVSFNKQKAKNTRFLPPVGVCLHHRCVFVWGISGCLYREGLRRVLSSVSVCAALQKRLGFCGERLCTRGHSNRVKGNVCMCVHVCTRLSLFIQVLSSDASWHVPQMLLAFNCPSISVLGSLHHAPFLWLIKDGIETPSTL